MLFQVEGDCGKHLTFSHIAVPYNYGIVEGLEVFVIRIKYIQEMDLQLGVLCCCR